MIIPPHEPASYYDRIDFSKTRKGGKLKQFSHNCLVYTGYCRPQNGDAQLRAFSTGFPGSRKISIQKIIVATRDFLPLFGINFRVKRLCGNPHCLEQSHLKAVLTEEQVRMVTEYRKEIIKNTQMDKYYTKKCIAQECYEYMKNFLTEHNVKNIMFIEPSAGAGVFLDVVGEPCFGFDLSPGRDDIYKLDFLIDDFRKTIAGLPKNVYTIGNPPFGKKSVLAVEFLNKSLKYTKAVGFILPIQFRKWSVHSKISKGAKLLADFTLPEYSFEFMGKDYGVRCCFQIWVNENWKTALSDLRIKSKPPTTHNDFEMWQYNCTEEAKKFFDKSVYKWDFGVPRQGFADYSKKILSPEECNPKQQWIFFRARDEEILRRLITLNFNKLSLKNTGTPGFGKADVVQEYIQLYGEN